MDRWKLSPDHATLTITRQVIQGMQQSEGVAVYRGEGWRAPADPPAAAAAPPARSESTDAVHPIPVRPQVRTAPPIADTEVTVPAGTHIALALRNAVDTKHSKEGDRIYLETIYPVAAGGRIAIPRGSFVNGTDASANPWFGRREVDLVEIPHWQCPHNGRRRTRSTSGPRPSGSCRACSSCGSCSRSSASDERSLSPPCSLP